LLRGWGTILGNGKGSAVSKRALGAYQPFHRVGTACSFPGDKAAGAWSWTLTFI
jgi:hypothetical protein